MVVTFDSRTKQQMEEGEMLALDRAEMAGTTMGFALPKTITVATVTGSWTENIEEFCDLVATATGVKVSFTRVYSPERAREIPFDRLLLLGGGDIDPALYGQKRTHAQLPSASRDETEWILANRAKAENIPTLGICRGHQMICAVHGGTLFQDFATQTGTSHGYQHRLIDIKAPLGRYLPSETTNSYHHQSVDVVPEGFTVLARASDGIIESIGKPGTIGVQWHPESHLEDDAAWAPLFLWFLLDGLRWDI